jgi:hypothetical protein
MLKVKPEERCSAKYVITHDWMKHNSIENLSTEEERDKNNLIKGALENLRLF